VKCEAYFTGTRETRKVNELNNVPEAFRFLKEGRTGDCGMLETPEKIRELQRKLYQKAKQVRKPLEEDDRRAVFGKTECTV